MQFVDEATIEVLGGDGGRGLISFRREAHVPLGGPDGGSGGRGANVIVEANERVTTLLDHRYKRWYKGGHGSSGGPKNMTGRGASDLVVPLPVGTVVIDDASGEIVADLTEVGQRIVVAKGGRGGRGNASFKTATRRAPRFAQQGEPGEQRVLKLNLRLMADVGLVGLPNAGKSTMIRSISSSQAVVADYPFTTLTPNLGVVRQDEKTFVVADVPGLIKGASEGLGLGDRFLKHLDRTRVLVHLISLGPESIDPLEAYKVITAELKQHSEDLAARPVVVVLNKVDLVDDRYELDLWTEAFGKLGIDVLFASALTKENLTPIVRHILKMLEGEGLWMWDEPEGDEPWSPL